MRNSFHTAGFSEVMHEIQENPAEADYLYTAHARSSAHRGLTAWIGPALFGSVKSARTLGVEVRRSAVAESAPSPLELALTGVAACGVTTLIGGGSARELVFDSAEMLIEYGPAATSQDAGAVRCRLEIDGAVDDRAMADLVRQMCTFSPNMATLARAVPVCLASATDADGAGREELDADDAVEPTVTATACRVKWISSTQLESYPGAGTGGPVLRVDQPRQLTGVDWGPNPQEYLLMGLCADLADHLAQTSARLTGAEHCWEVAARGREDMHGILCKQLDSVPLHDVRLTVVVPKTLASPEEAEKIVQAAFALSEVRRLIAAPHDPNVTLVLGC